MEVNLPLVSVVAISYNEERYVADTLDSIKRQTYPNIELIISDDASSDSTKEIIKTWIAANYPAAKFINHQKNLGITKNLNSTIPYITGQYVKIIGCDDVLLDDTITTIMSTFKNLPADYGVVYSDMYVMDENSVLKDYSIIEKRKHPTPSGYVYKEMIAKPFITAASVIIKKEVLDKLGRFNEKVFYEDHDTFLRASKFFKFHYIPEKLVKYRAHSASQINISSRIRYFTNEYNVYMTSYDSRRPYKEEFLERMLFCIKNLYSHKFKRNFIFCMKAFFKTGEFQFIKYGVASIHFLITGKNK